MKKTVTPKNKLSQYTLAAAAFLTAGAAHAEVVYVDLDPDEMIGGEGAELTLDINADGTDDFMFNIYSFSGSLTYGTLVFTYHVNAAVIQALGDNEMVGTVQSVSGTSINYLPQLESGQIIGGDGDFVSGYATMGVQVLVFGTPYYTIGNWPGAEEAYLGFKLVLDETNYYGWMRISVTEEVNLLTIHDYAYQNTAEQSITAGQMVAIEGPGELTGVNCYSYGGQVNITVSGSPEKSLTAGIFTLGGQLVKEVTDIWSNHSVDCSDMPEGNYIVRLSDGTQTTTRQLFIGR